MVENTSTRIPGCSASSSQSGQRAVNDGHRQVHDHDVEVNWASSSENLAEPGDVFFVRPDPVGAQLLPGSLESIPASLVGSRAAR
jgi:hypothetical protein